MIDEKKLIEEMEETFTNDFLHDKKWFMGRVSFMDVFKTLIEDIPKVGNWIPCSRELPSSDGRFEVTIKGSKGKRHVEMCNYSKDAKVVFGNEKWQGENVIAWRQRPEPYNEEVNRSN